MRATPILNYPEVGILGVSRAKWTPTWDGKDFVPRLILPFCLSYDHRVIDGATGSRVLREVADFMADPATVLALG